ncbi:hypothetical protein BTA51_18120 [Hahella sp. CCB-MM4]|uniref:HD domain-containing protein n=1 Tax=Hahella sp. (strain CCB-MM4) TaxID=1926491 RepID=UPI000B9A5B5D|nr:HD domain-containing protein [Hahella sp. CCB-MM4]OZG71923.1 hypothetical protein BTA51_18120 [Hahella sp. CCB-MM4]
MAATRLGTRHWALTSKGRMTFWDQMHYIRSSIKVQLKTNLPVISRNKSWKSTEALLDRVSVPDTILVKASQEYVRGLASDELFNHSIRAYFWGSLLKLADRQSMDDETLYLSCLFHDLGLTDSFHDQMEGAECFTLESAEAGDQFMLQHDVDNSTRDTIYNAITLHLNPAVCGHEHGWLAHYLNAGTACDVIGLRYGSIAKPDRETVLNNYPRGAFKSALVDIFKKEKAIRPCSRIALMSRFGFLNMIRQAPFGS